MHMQNIECEHTTCGDHESIRISRNKRLNVNIN